MRLLKFIKRPEGNGYCTVGAHFTDGKEVSGFHRLCGSFDEIKQFIRDLRYMCKNHDVKGDPIEKTRYADEWAHYLSKSGVYKNLGADKDWLKIHGII